MKYAVHTLLSLVFLSGCSPGTSAPVTNGVGYLTQDSINSNIGKFRDGDIVCYKYFNNGISCVVLPEVK
jgi:hypothetical protein